MFSPMEIAAVVGVAILVFGADKLPKLAKSAGQAKKEFLIGQAEADVAAEKARDEARKQATVNVEAATASAGPGTTGAIPDPVAGTTVSAAAPPHAS
jgi:sec-independent protein translocase protein TatA